MAALREKDAEVAELAVSRCVMLGSAMHEDSGFAYVVGVCGE
jgi:hypothetical protein